MPIQPTKENIKKWQDVVAKSGGRSVFIPEQFLPEWNKIEEDRAAFNKKLIAIAEEEIKMNVRNQKYWLEVRDWLAKNGYPDVWVKEVGPHRTAVDEGVAVLNIMDGPQR